MVCVWLIALRRINPGQADLVLLVAGVRAVIVSPSAILMRPGVSGSGSVWRASIGCRNSAAPFLLRLCADVYYENRWHGAKQLFLMLQSLALWIEILRQQQSCGLRDK
jgi:hypothetical protein